VAAVSRILVVEVAAAAAPEEEAAAPEEEAVEVLYQPLSTPGHRLDRRLRQAQW